MRYYQVTDALAQLCQQRTRPDSSVTLRALTSRMVELERLARSARGFRHDGYDRSLRNALAREILDVRSALAGVK